MQDFTKGGVQGKRRRFESAVTHHPFHSQPPELIRPNPVYFKSEKISQLSFCQVQQRLLCRKLHHVNIILNEEEICLSRSILNFQPGSNLRQIILHDMEFPLPAGIDISKGLPPLVYDNVKVRVIPHTFLETFYHLRNLLSLVLGDGSNQLKHYANMNPI